MKSREKNNIVKTPGKNQKGFNELAYIIHVLLSRKLVLIGLVIILVTVVAAIFAPLLAPYDPNQTNMKETLLQPNKDHLLGTDSLGRDTLSRLIFGARISLLVAIVGVGISAVSGMMLGLVAGYFGGILGKIIMRFIDTMMAFPMVILSLTIATLLGGGITGVIIAVGVGLMALYARVMWGQVMIVRQNDYILAERAMGANDWSIMMRHMLPNCFPVLVVMVTIQMGAAILMEAGLSFLGVGILPPTAAWGSMVANGYNYLTTVPILSFAPGIAIMLVVFGFNMVGDGIRDAFDPRLRGKI